MITEEELIGMVKPLCVKFLRQATVLTQIIQPQQLVEIQEIPQDFDQLMNFLKLVPLPTLLQNHAKEIKYISINWCSQYISMKNKLTIPELGPISKTKLIDLPATFQELVLKFLGVKCTSCKTLPKQAAICLICGKFCCVASQCCFLMERGECARHALECGGGIFIMLKSTYVLVVRGDRRTAWGSLYIDEHGEEDIGFQRGKTLYLNIPRYNELKQMWLTSSFDHNSKILASTVRDGHFV